MKQLYILIILFLWPQEPMIAPKVEHREHKSIQTYDEVIRSCPEGYEGHFVDTRKGFDSSIYIMDGYQSWYDYGAGGPPGFTVCFKKEFMDKVRSNPELLVPRPAPPRPV